ncbi:MAG TPA: FAD-dependent oxidoreductase, partial [Candidatus Caenarcaniphilales bacterium]
MQQAQPVVKDLVLIGGGHSHAIALKLFGMKPLPGVRLTLITPQSYTSYSGMLPGHVAGFYDFDQCHIDLRPLAHFAQAQLLLDRAIGLDLKNDRVICAHHPDVAFDLLSLDIGSTPATTSIPGAMAHTIPIRPVDQFLAHWHQIVERVTQAPEKPLRLGLIGGGAGGVELALAMQYRLQQIFKAEGQPSTKVEIHLFHRGVELMAATHNQWTRQRFKEILRQRGIKLHLEETVTEVQEQAVVCESGLTVECDRVFWVTQASAAPWLREAGLATDEKGFVQVQETLQSISHPQVFAAGDIATIVNHPRPKAGVFAVREGKPLFHNLQRALLGKPLQGFKPQKQYLSLISTGNQSAVASRGAFGFESRLLWYWKDRIDRKFVQRFTVLPDMSQGTHAQRIWYEIRSWFRRSQPSQRSGSNGITPPGGLINSKALPDAAVLMRCGGCGSKISSNVLERVLSRINLEQPDWVDQDNILIGLNAADDAAVVQVPAGQVMVHSLDYFRTMINDSFV